jgi:thiol-disulfide isomerase/thioredoxin
MMLFPIWSLFRKRVNRWLAGSILLAAATVGALFANMSPVAAVEPSNAAGTEYRSGLPFLGALPSLSGATTWLNSSPLKTEQLRGKVVLVNFWTYSCIYCIRTFPHMRVWAEKYRGQGLVVIGVHTPEFGFEKENSNINKAVQRFQIDYPVAVDSERRLWNSFRNNAWPAFYIADAKGQVRARLAGEGNYEKTERVIQSLLAEAGKREALGLLMTPPQGSGEQAAPDLAHLRSDETYVGYAQASNYASGSGLKRDVAHDYALVAPDLNRWSLAGNWTVGAERANLNEAGGRIVYRFSARDLHLVLRPGADGNPVRFQVKIDGRAPGKNHGSDTDEQGNGVVTASRLYQLVRQSGAPRECTFEIRFLDAGVGVFAFTFG